MPEVVNGIFRLTWIGTAAQPGAGAERAPPDSPGALERESAVLFRSGTNPDFGSSRVATATPASGSTSMVTSRREGLSSARSMTPASAPLR